MPSIRTKTALRTVLTSTAILLGLTGIIPANAQGTAAPGLSEPIDQVKLLAAAKKEGSLTWYTNVPAKDVPVLLAPFEKQTGLKVNVWRANGDKLVQRVVTENSAKRHDVDVINSGAAEVEALHREKLLQPVRSPAARQLIAEATPAHAAWVGIYVNVWVQAYNTNLLKKADLPKTFADLLDPKWKGKLGIEATNSDWFYNVVLDMGEEKGLRFFQEMVSKNGVSVRRGSSLLNNMVVAGEVPFALTVFSKMPQAAKEGGAPIDWIILEPALGTLNAVALARNPPHPNAARLFYEYLISENAQKLMASMEYIPTHGQVPSSLKDVRFKTVDPVKSLDEQEKWEKAFDDTFVKRAAR